MTDVSAPHHVGFILDGNRRWADEQGVPRLEGHRAGYKNLKTIAKETFDRGAEVVSAYIFSTENWDRSEEEVSYLMDLAMWIFKNELKEFEKEKIRIVFMGSMDRLSDKLRRAIIRAEERTKDFTRGTLALCFNYGGQNEIVDAVRSLVEQGVEAKDVTKDSLQSHLYAPEMPPVDLVIRTSGEQRISNFMLWRIAYAELIFCSKYWPAYTIEDLADDLDTYNIRKRRFGG